MSVVGCQPKFLAMGWSLAERSPTKCSISHRVWLWSLGNRKTLTHQGLLRHGGEKFIRFTLVKLILPRCIPIASYCWYNITRKEKKRSLTTWKQSTVHSDFEDNWAEKLFPICSSFKILNPQTVESAEFLIAPQVSENFTAFYTTGNLTLRLLMSYIYIYIYIYIYMSLEA